MSVQKTPAAAPVSRPDPRRLVTRAKLATIVGSVAGFGAVAGLVLADPVGVTSRAPDGTPAAQAPVAATATASAQQPAAPTADEFFSPPPGFSEQPPLVGGTVGQGAGDQGVGSGAGAGGLAPQGVGGRTPIMRSSGS